MSYKRYKFFRWHCPVCGVAGGVQMPEDSKEEIVLLECQDSHDSISLPKDEYCEGRVCIGKIA